MKQSKIHKIPKDRNIYDISGFENYTEHHNERQDAGKTLRELKLEKETGENEALKDDPMLLNWIKQAKKDNLKRKKQNAV
jgi:hypothetical protein